MLTLHLEKTLGEFSVNVAFASESRATALFGPSGAGKTSLINMIAGLLRPDRGRVEIDGEVLFDSAARIDVPPWRRRIGYVFQEGRLFPHFTVRHNLEYGRWMGGHKFDPSAFQHVVELLDIGHLLDRRPGSFLAENANA
jgi:molybdate transport system ATP-binding protein